MKRRELIPELDSDALRALPTKQLLARLQRLRQCEGSAELSDLPPSELERVVGIRFKNTAAWRRAYDELKAVLATREHVGR